MVGLQVIRLLDVADVNEIFDAEGVVPRTLVIRGKDFRSVETVLLHGFTAPQIVVLNETTILAQVPPVLVNTPIYDVTVLSSNFTLTERSLIELGIGTKVKKVSGILRLLQTFVRLLLRTPGTNIFHPSTGGGIAAVIGQNMTGAESADVAVGIRRVAEDIIARQSQVREIPPAERLLAAELTGFTPDPQTGSLYATVLITNHSGQGAAATIAT